MAASEAAAAPAPAKAATAYIAYNTLFCASCNAEKILRASLADAAGDGNLLAVEELLIESADRNFIEKDFLSDAIIRAAGSGERTAKRILSVLFGRLCDPAAEDVVQKAMLGACEEGNSEAVAFLVEYFYTGKAPAAHLKNYLLSVRAIGNFHSIEDKWWSLSVAVFGGNVKEGLKKMGEGLTGRDFEVLVNDSSPAEIIFMLEILGVTKDQVCLHVLSLVSDFDTMKYLYSFYRLKFWDVYNSESFHAMCLRGHLGVAKFMFDRALLEIKKACEHPDSKGAKWLADQFGPGLSHEHYITRWANPVRLVIQISRAKKEECMLHVLKWILCVFPPREATISELIEGGISGLVSGM